jgi:hypothetical protein
MNTQSITSFIFNLVTIINILFFDGGSAAPVVDSSSSSSTEAVALIRARNAYLRLLESEIEPHDVDVVADPSFKSGDPEDWFLRPTDAE